MLRFLEDADLVEQERDDIHRILFTERKAACEFPFAVDASVVRAEDDAACLYAHLSSSESLRGETEVSSRDNRRSPATSLSTPPNARRHTPSTSKGEQTNRSTISQTHSDQGSPKKNDTQTSNNLPATALMAGYTAMTVIPPAAASCFSPPFVAGQQNPFFPAAFVHPQYVPILHTYGNVGSYFVPHVVPRPSPQVSVASVSSPLGMMRLPFGQGAPTAGYPTMNAAPTLYTAPRPFVPNMEHGHMTHFSMENVSSAAPFIGTAVIQDDASMGRSRTSSQPRTNLSDDYQQQSTSPNSVVSEVAPTILPDDSAAGPSLREEDEVIASCDSPTIVIGADQNAAAAASRLRASALMNSSSTSVIAEASGSSSSRIPAMESGPAYAAAPTSSSAPPIDTTNCEMGFRSPTQSPRSSQNNESNGAPPLSPSSAAREGDALGLDIYYDAEDKPLLQNSSAPNGVEVENSCDDITRTGSEETSKPVREAAAAGASESGDTVPVLSSATTKKTWAGLFKDCPTAKGAIVKPLIDSEYRKLDSNSAKQKGDISTRGAASHGSEGVMTAETDPAATRLAEMLRKSEFIHRGPTFVLRGIVNSGNWCYVNATLQALMACPPFYHFLRSLAPYVQRVNSSTPLLDACVKLAMEFPLIDRSGRVTSNRTMQPLEPNYLYSIISRLKSDASFKGRQEDAEEFLLQMFNALHDEMVSCISLLEKDRADPSSNIASESEDIDNSEWQQVGPNRKVAITRQMTHTQSPLSQLFLGQLRYGLNPLGAKESAVVEPFYTLPLDVQLPNVKDIVTALQQFTSKETLKNFAGKNKTEVDATRRVTFLELPRVMIFQLKYFLYTEEGLTKIIKPMDYSMDLIIDRELLYNRGKTSSTYARQYKLFAVVFHHGDKAEGGHYTVDIFHGGQWVHVDDTKITPVGNDHVLHFVPPRVPYLLFYRRWDTVTTDSQQR